MESMCSTRQSPRAAKAFWSACAARTWPAPEDAERRRTRGLRVMDAGAGSRGLPGAGSEFLENGAAKLLQFAETREIFLKFLIEKLGVLRAEFVSQNHVAEFHGVGKKSVFLKLFKRCGGVVMVHGGSYPGENDKEIVRAHGSTGKSRRTVSRGHRVKYQAGEWRNS